MFRLLAVEVIGQFLLFFSCFYYTLSTVLCTFLTLFHLILKTNGHIGGVIPILQFSITEL